jgi:hypothetical protein
MVKGMHTDAITTHANGHHDVNGQHWTALLGDAPAHVVNAIAAHADTPVDNPIAETEAVVAAATERLWIWRPDEDVVERDRLLERTWRGTGTDAGFTIAAFPGDGFVVTRPDTTTEIHFGPWAPAAAVIAAAFTPAA